ncbi:hypothetical protein ANN_19820 [Periplaneta americana]|uniref:Serpin domain-containing protein n=1 Tax=Periplaneta americana TaxID=6978 RepID=A0ABQ8SB62_PERAM|nr:hypothetical protein ANN_19820 [Periplaneta americana]
MADLCEGGNEPPGSLKATRVITLRNESPGVPLPPVPVLTRWGSRLQACIYLHERLSNVKKVIGMFDKNDAAFIGVVQLIRCDPSIEQQCHYIVSFNSANRGNNTILAPMSLYTVLAMLQQGAGGTTQDELNYALHAQPTSTKEGLKSIIQNLTRSHLPVLLEFANKLFVKSGLIISPDFKNVSVEDFKSGIEVLDFSQAEAAAQIKNSWVAEYTHQRIPDIIPSRKFM